MQKDATLELKTLRVDGGACANNLLMQFQADIIEEDVERPVIIESTALGAAFFAGLYTGFFTIDKIKSTKKIDTCFKPKMNNEKRLKLIKGWKKAVERTKDWDLD
jgi:glycerol kinase